MTPICKRRGCNQPVVAGKRGNPTDYCATHLAEQQAVWRAKEQPRRAVSSNGSTVRTLRMCPHCGRGYWLPAGVALTCDCADSSSKDGSVNLALIAPTQDGGGLVSLFSAQITPTGMLTYTPEPSDYRAVREQLRAGYLVAVVSEV